jgi:hypothetical protein
MAGQRSAVRQPQIALRPLQGLDRGLLVDAENDRVLRRRHVKLDHIGRLGDERRVGALAPGFAPGEVNLLGPQEAPHLRGSPFLVQHTKSRDGLRYKSILAI